LTAIDPRKSRIVELKFFGGLTTKEIAEVLQLSPRRSSATGALRVRGSTTPSAVEPERTQMDTDRWQRIQELFQAVIARAAEERSVFIAGACAGDDALRHQLDRLGRAHERSVGFLETPLTADAFRILASADDSS